MEATAGASAPASLVRVVSGNPTAEELAAVVAVIAAAVAAAAGAGSGAESGPVSQWTSRERAVRIAPRPSRDGWRSSAFPPAL